MDETLMENRKRSSNEVLLYSLIFLLAFLVRFLLLGKQPLLDREATFAWQAWQIWKGDALVIGNQVGYLSITKALFSVFGSGEFLARSMPAFVGSLIILIPFLTKDRFGRLSSLVLAVGLALDPTLVVVSRLAGSPLPAVVFLFLALIAFQVGHLPWTLLLVFLGLFSGPAFWFGITILAVTVLLSWMLGIFDPGPYLKTRMEMILIKDHPSRFQTRDFALPMLVVIILGSFFFTRLQGLSAWLGSPADYFRSWFSLPAASYFQLLISLAVSSPLILIFGGLGFYQAWKEDDRLGKIASIWFGIALLLLLLYSGRQSTDLMWLIVPLWLGAARELIRIFNLAEWNWPVYVLGALTGILVIMNWLTFTGMIFQVGNQQAGLLQWGLIGASLALVILAVTIVASEWGWPSAKMGFSLGAAGMLLIFTLAVMAQGAYLSSGDPRSLWSDGSGSGQMDLLLDTVGEISVSQTGRWDSLQVGVVDASDNLRWVLRGLNEVEIIEAYQSEFLPPILITSQLDQYLVPLESYRGQDFVSRTKRGWQGLLPPDWISWIAFRDGPIEFEHIILWVRGDILVGEDQGIE